MVETGKFLERVNLRQEQLGRMVLKISKLYEFGQPHFYRIATSGYEDLNFSVYSDRGVFFVKMFSDERSNEDCRRIVGTMIRAREEGISHPKILRPKGGKGPVLSEISTPKGQKRFCVMGFVDGKTKFELQEPLLKDEEEFVIQQAAIINKSEYRPQDIAKDSWSIHEMTSIFLERFGPLSPSDRAMVGPVVEQMEKIDHSKLPYALVHRDIRSPNLMKDKSGQLSIIDWSVAAYLPRITELAVLLCDLFFDDSSSLAYKAKYDWIVTEYQKYLQLDPIELEVLPLYVKAAHAMNLLCANFEQKVNKNTGQETAYWFERGRKGLEMAQGIAA